MNQLILILVPVAAFSQWWIAYRRRKLAEAELEIAKTVTGMQKKMLDASISHGECSHDILFEIMQNVMLSQRYGVPWNLFRGKSREAVKLAERLEKEIGRESCPFAELFVKFNRAYFSAFSYKHPFQHLFFPLYVLALYIMAKGFVYTLKTMLHFIMHTAKIKNALRKKYVELTAGSLEINKYLDGLTV